MSLAVQVGREGMAERAPSQQLFADNGQGVDPIYPTPPLGQDMTQGQFLSGV